MEIVMDIWEAILRSDPAPWVRQRYVQKLRNYLHTRYREEEKVADLLNRLPEGPALLLDMANDPNERWWLERLDPYLRPELRMKNQQVN